MYPPKKLMKQLGLKEGYTIVFRVENNRLIVEKIKDPWTLALQTRKWAETTVEEFESESEELQEAYTSEKD